MNSPNVVFVLLDTVRADRVSALGYDRKTTPNFDAFADEETLYTDAVAQAPWSVPSHASLFTGTYPAEHGATIASPVLTGEPTLAELLSDAGYDTYAVSPNEYVRPATGFARGFDSYETLSLTEPSVVADLLARPVNWFTSTAWVRRPVEWAFNRLQSTGSVTTDPAPPAEDGLLDAVANRIERADDPFFLFVNLFDAHLPRSPAPEFARQFVDDDLADVPIVERERTHTLGGHTMDERGLRKFRQLYDADVRTTDERFGRLVGILRQSGVFEDSLVVAVSDHGEQLGEYGLVGHQFSVFDGAVSVPLAIRFPDGGPDRVDDQVEIRRLFHTVLDEAGARSYPEQSLRSGPGDELARGAYHSPMLDIEALLRTGTVRYDRDLLGEPLSFVRDGDTKVVSFDGTEWLFETPERGQPPITKADPPGLSERLPITDEQATLEVSSNGRLD
ncbi:sulfatase-like hydrolase/transferase [Halovenus sp. WSH3]|uniref:Sulfatase-like hydrolase/transferase n=1 Tax=Halovenus carboxidivorans TaxID=2692199 RepID=A0A6B0T1J2_9EURY|nr:sulfatase [Halovenus carboxidivorans]MXR51914.1 sulfatase-like hydrolase/transferase [Halovenus carboxidivorans]